MSVLVGVDGGGSSTRAVVVRAEGETVEIMGRGSAGPSNPYIAGASQAAAHCETAAQEALTAAARIMPGLSRADIAAWGFGLAGVRRATDAAMVRPHLGSIVGRSLLFLDTDAVAAHAGAFGGGVGVVLVAGTGAISVARDSEGETFYADGWGPLLGDEGGGYWIGIEALKAVCRSADGRGPQTRLTAPVLSSLSARDTSEIVLRIYRNGFEREQIAKLSQVVFDTAAGGARVAAGIRDRAADALAQSAAATARALLTRRRERGLNGGEGSAIELAVALSGGLFEDELFRGSVAYRVSERLVELKREFLPMAGWRIVRSQFDAATGAALLARKLLA